jgi:hypothetical protein
VERFWRRWPGSGFSARKWVGEAGFEPATTSTQSSCTTGLCDSLKEPKI